MKKNLFQLTAASLLCYGINASAQNAINVQILSATVKDQKIEDAKLILQRNGEHSVTGNTNKSGGAVFKTALPDDASTLLIVKKDGYSNLVAKCPCAGMTYAISPVMKNLDGLRVVLNWGAEPTDLDSHILYPNNHIYFSNMKGTDALLDVDDTDSYGPETITIERKHEGERYTYAVHNFSESSNPNSISLSSSHAIVFVYIGKTLIKTYYVPKNKIGNVWNVFAITETGEFQNINTISGVTSSQNVSGDSSRLQTAQFQGIVDSANVETVNYTADAQTNAKNLNHQGEEAYHAGNYEEAIRLYQNAIELVGDYGQAYSNLGLAFQKVGNVAEALWANRKAIALASGKTAATVRASSHYNNGKIYEEASQWNDALREYQAAKQEKANPVYDVAIKRVQQQGAK